MADQTKSVFFLNYTTTQTHTHQKKNCTVKIPSNGVWVSTRRRFLVMRLSATQQTTRMNTKKKYVCVRWAHYYFYSLWPNDEEIKTWFFDSHCLLPQPNQVIFAKCASISVDSANFMHFIFINAMADHSPMNFSGRDENIKKKCFSC